MFFKVVIHVRMEESGAHQTAKAMVQRLDDNNFTDLGYVKLEYVVAVLHVRLDEDNMYRATLTAQSLVDQLNDQYSAKVESIVPDDNAGVARP